MRKFFLKSTETRCFIYYSSPVVQSRCFYITGFGGVGSLAVDMAWYRATQPNQPTFSASGCAKEGPFSATVEAEVRLNFSFAQGWFFFPGMHRPYFQTGAFWNFHAFWISYIILFSFFQYPQLKAILKYLSEKNIKTGQDNKKFVMGFHSVHILGEMNCKSLL